MQLIRGLHNLAQPLPPCAVTVGNFDGVHLGHQQVLRQLRSVAKQSKLCSAVIIFEPQPIEFFAPGNAPKRLARFREKIVCLQRQKIDYLLCVKFDLKFSELSADSFVRELLVKRLNTRHLVIGDDFRFGKNRHGDFEFLLAKGRQYNFAVENTETLRLDGIRVSSTRIRECIQQNNFELAAALLGRSYSLSGKVSHGQKLGQQLGYPTINIKMGQKTLIVKGIFAVMVKGIDNRALQGVASLGTRPTVNGADTILEVFILDFNQNVYGCNVEVDFLHKIRDEKKFNSLKELKANIDQDVVLAKQYFQQLT